MPTSALVGSRQPRRHALGRRRRRPARRRGGQRHLLLLFGYRRRTAPRSATRSGHRPDRSSARRRVTPRPRGGPSSGSRRRTPPDPACSPRTRAGWRSSAAMVRPRSPIPISNSPTARRLTIEEVRLSAPRGVTERVRSDIPALGRRRRPGVRLEPGPGNDPVLLDDGGCRWCSDGATASTGSRWRRGATSARIELGRHRTASGGRHHGRRRRGSGDLELRTDDGFLTVIPRGWGWGRRAVPADRLRQRRRLGCGGHRAGLHRGPGQRARRGGCAGSDRPIPPDGRDAATT